VVGRIPVGRRPWGIAVSRDGRTLYTADGLSNAISVIDTRSRKVTGTVNVGRQPWGVAVSP
jgi:YVTN family beta-propeller protein